MKEDLGISQETIDVYRQLAKYNYECGKYEDACKQLENYISLFAKPPLESATDQQQDDDIYAPTSSTSPTNTTQATGNAHMYYLESASVDMLQVLWGKLACEITSQHWKEASVALQAVKTCIEELASTKQLSPLQALEERTWLLHWSLFVYWTLGHVDSLVEFWFEEKYKQAIMTNAPHLLRYLVAAVLISKRNWNMRQSQHSSDSRRLLKNLSVVMQNVEYTDAICDFVSCLVVKFDFEGAQAKLQQCEKLLESDFFLCEQTKLFMEEARVFVFENYCRIHDKIDLKTLGEQLAMPQEEAERWIVDLIRKADISAKIDSAQGCVVIGGSSQSVYQQVMERTRDLNVRSATLVQNLNNVLADARKEKAKRERAAREED